MSRSGGALAGSAGALRLGKGLVAPRWGLSRECAPTLGGGWSRAQDVALVILSLPRLRSGKGIPTWSPGYGPNCGGLEVPGPCHEQIGVLSTVPCVLLLGLTFFFFRNYLFIFGCVGSSFLCKGFL